MVPTKFVIGQGFQIQMSLNTTTDYPFQNIKLHSCENY